MKRTKRNKVITLGGLGVATAILSTTAAFAAPGAQRGPSSSADPYVVRSVPGVVTRSILTSGDAINGYRMVGIPDGLGAFDNGDGTFTLLMNHELGAGAGRVRDHGATGAFVSKWTIDKGDLRVRGGEDLIKRVFSWDGGGARWQPTTTSFNRLCSSDLADASAFFDATTGKGTTERLFLNGEEAGAEGRVFAHVVTGSDAGSSFELPWLGKASWENVVAMPGTGDQTVVVGMDDSGGGQVYVYVGTKQLTGNDVERAGLTNGKLYGMKITGVAAEGDATTVPAAGTPFTLVEIPGVATMTGAQLEAASNSLGVSKLNRPEDGSWDPTRRGTFYFATTASFTGISRVWQLNFSDGGNVGAGGTAAIAVASPAYDATKSNVDQAGPRMIDNITVDDRGRLLLQEDPGGNDYISGVFQLDPSTGAFARVARHDPDRFAVGAAGFLTRDEESSGVIPVPFLGEGKFLLDVQAHYATDAETVEGGQLLLLQLPPGKPTAG